MSYTLKSKNIETPYLKHLKKDIFKKGFVENCDFLIPQFYLKKRDDIKNFYKVKLYFNNFKQSYQQLKLFLQSNERYLLENVSNLNIDLSLKNNILFKKTETIHPFNNKKEIIQSLKEYKKNKSMYTSVSGSLFLKILNDFMKNDERYIYVKFYNVFNAFKNKLLLLPNSIGILGYDPLFNINNTTNRKNKSKNKENNISYVLLNNNINSTKNTKNIKNTKNNNSSRKNINEYVDKYKSFYEPYNYKRDVKKLIKRIETYFKTYCELSSKVDKKKYVTIGELLIDLLDMEYYLIHILFYYNDMHSYEMILKQDVEIKNYITRNMLNFENFSANFSDTFQKVLPSGNISALPSYNFKAFFANNVS